MIEPVSSRACSTRLCPRFHLLSKRLSYKHSTTITSLPLNMGGGKDPLHNDQTLGQQDSTSTLDLTDLQGKLAANFSNKACH